MKKIMILLTLLASMTSLAKDNIQEGVYKQIRSNHDGDISPRCQLFIEQRAGQGEGVFSVYFRKFTHLTPDDEIGYCDLEGIDGMGATIVLRHERVSGHTYSKQTQTVYISDRLDLKISNFPHLTNSKVGLSVAGNVDGKLRRYLFELEE